MTGLLAFNSNTRGDRSAGTSRPLGVADLGRTSNTGRGGLPKTYTRKRSLNAKYDRLLGNTHSMRTGRGSTQTLAEVGSQFRVREEEEKEKVKKDNMEIYRKLGIKMPASRGRDLHGGVGVMANLNKYRLGSITPPRGNTPPVQLDEKLRSILYPPAPPPTPPAPTPSPIQLLSEQYYPAGAKIAKTPQSSSRPRHHCQARDYQQPAHHPQQQTPLRQVHYPPPPPPPTAGPPSVQGWIYTPQNGWIYIPPPQPYFAHGGYPGIPPPPPFTQEATYQAYPSPYSDTPTSHDQENIPSSSYYNTSSPDYDLEQGHEQVRPFPKSILRDTSSSETSGHGRSVKFRDTPEYNSPELYQREVEEYETPVVAPEPEADVCAPPRWTLHKAPTAHQPARRPDDEDDGQHYRGHSEQDQGRSQEIYAQPQRQAYHQDSGMQQNAPIPALLATAHQQLLSGHGLTPAQVASGKRSGRDLIRSLESMAEIQDRTDRGDDTAPGTTNGDVQMDDDYHYQENTSGDPHPVTPRRQVLENGHSKYHQTDIRQPQLDPRRESTDRDQTCHLEQYEHDKTEASPMFEPRPQTSPTHENARTPGRHLTTNGPMNLSSRHAPRRREEHRTPDFTLQDLSSRHGPGIPDGEVPNARQIRHAPYREEESNDAGSQERSPPHQHKTSVRQRPSKNRFPPPSQNWRESQRPQMAFSQTESIGSQVPVSQTSYRGSQDHPGSSRKKRSRQEWEDEDLENAAPEDEKEEGVEDGQQAQTFDRYSPNQLSQDTTSNPHSQDCSSRHRPHSQTRQERLPEKTSRSSQQQSSPPIPTSTSTSKRHRLTDLDLPIDTDDPSDTSYRPPNSYPGDQDQDEDEEYEDQPESASPEPEPEGKRIKLTEGAWIKYDIPQDKLPIPRRPIQARKTRPVTTRLIKPIKNESQSQSQISQIEQSDDEEDTSMSWLGEDIDESLSQIYSDVSAKGNKNGKLSTIAEEEDEEDDEDEEMEVGQVHGGGGGGGQKGWVEEGFFGGEGGGTGFTVWRDRY